MSYKTLLYFFLWELRITDGWLGLSLNRHKRSEIINASADKINDTNRKSIHAPKDCPSKVVQHSIQRQ
ncbi:hypothetical protein [Photobacterium malacitanum]|uniref:hypothetical protein n=1 Tax=Photobacterium malacitanum TaxID=2204294 RepID=UPI000B40D615|nr:hypothetical protein [Photobacterium malacitanum]